MQCDVRLARTCVCVCVHRMKATPPPCTRRAVALCVVVCVLALRLSLSLASSDADAAVAAAAASASAATAASASSASVEPGVGAFRFGNGSGSGGDPPLQPAWLSASRDPLSLALERRFPSRQPRRTYEVITATVLRAGTTVTPQLSAGNHSYVDQVLVQRSFVRRTRYSCYADMIWVRIGMPHVGCCDFPLDEFGKSGFPRLINRLPGGGQQFNVKDTFANNLRRLAVETRNSTVLSIHPQTFAVPEHIDEVVSAHERSPTKWILKPAFGGRGQGIHLLRPSSTPEQLRELIATYAGSTRYLVQRYIQNPLLIRGRKFTLRKYLLVTSVDPLRVYLYEKGIAKFCAVPFSTDDEQFGDGMANQHITNEAFNKYHPDFDVSGDPDVDDHGSRISYAAIKRHLAKLHGEERVAQLQRDVERTMLTALAAVVRPVRETAANRSLTGCAIGGPSRCFQMFGVDIDLDDTLHPWFIEANVNPSLGLSTAAFDNRNRAYMLQNLFDLVGASSADRAAVLTDVRARVERAMPGRGGAGRANESAMRVVVPDDSLTWTAELVHEGALSRGFKRLFPPSSPAALRALVPGARAADVASAAETLSVPEYVARQPRTRQWLQWLAAQSDALLESWLAPERARELVHAAASDADVAAPEEPAAAVGAADTADAAAERAAHGEL